MDSVPGIPELTVAPPAEQIPAAPAPLEPEVMSTTGEPVKRKRHRRTKAELEAARTAAAPPPPSNVASTEDLDRCRLGFIMLFGLASVAIVKKWGEEMALKEEEIKTLAGVWTDAVAPYLPSMGKNMPLATAALATAIIALPRWQMYKTAQAAEPAT